jgi:hypothetical protein
MCNNFLQEMEIDALEQLISEDVCDNPTRDNFVLSHKPLHLVIKW